LNLDAYQFTPESRLVLIDAGDFDDFGEKVFGQFGNVTFIGNTTAEVVYDLTSGDVYLQNFQRAGAAATSAAVPEPGSLTGLLLVVAHLCFARRSRQRVA
jgi:hypothetical protein